MDKYVSRARTVAAASIFALGAMLPQMSDAAPLSFDLEITGSVGNTVTSTNLPLSFSNVGVVAGSEISGQAVNLSFLSSGFTQTFSGTVNVDLSDGQLVLGFSGTAQGVNLGFNLTNITFDTPQAITGATQTASSGVLSGVNQTIVPSFGANSLSGGFSMFGFQPGTNLSQTIAFTTQAITPPPPPPPMPDIPLPASLPLALAGLGVFAWMRRRQDD